MPNLIVNGFNIGQDCSVSFTSDGGVPGAVAGAFSAEMLGHLMSFEAEVMDQDLDVYPISNYGSPLFDTVYKGWKGKCVFTRANGNLMAMFADLSNRFFTAGTRIHFGINVAILNRDGTSDTMQFTNSSLSKGHLGDHKADKEVEQSFAWRASGIITSLPTSLATAVGIFIPG